MRNMLYTDETAGQATPPSCGTGNPESAPPPAPHVRVWLVDDNDELRTLIADLLGQQAGIECARHFSSPDALLSELASKPGPDVILLDVQMGDRNGLDAVRPIKSLARSTRVMMYTTCYNYEWQERAFGDGASDYLLKSEAVEKVADRIRSPANHSALNTHYRRRYIRPAERAGTGFSVDPVAGKSPHLLRRTLKMLRSLWN